MTANQMRLYFKINSSHTNLCMIIIELKTFTGFFIFETQKKKMFIILRVIDNITCMKILLAY